MKRQNYECLILFFVNAIPKIVFIFKLLLIKNNKYMISYVKISIFCLCLPNTSFGKIIIKTVKYCLSFYFRFLIVSSQNPLMKLKTPICFFFLLYMHKYFLAFLRCTNVVNDIDLALKK